MLLHLGRCRDRGKRTPALCAGEGWGAGASRLRGEEPHKAPLTRILCPFRETLRGRFGHRSRAPGPFSPRWEEGAGKDWRNLGHCGWPLPSALCPLPPPTHERGGGGGDPPRPEAPPHRGAHSLCLLRTWPGLGFPHAKLGSPPFLTSGWGAVLRVRPPQSPRPHCELEIQGRGGAGAADRCAAPGRWERAGEAAGLPAPLPGRGVCPAAPRRARGAAGHPASCARGAGRRGPAGCAAQKGLSCLAPHLCLQICTCTQINPGQMQGDCESSPPGKGPALLSAARGGGDGPGPAPPGSPHAAAKAALCTAEGLRLCARTLPARGFQAASALSPHPGRWPTGPQSLSPGQPLLEVTFSVKTPLTVLLWVSSAAYPPRGTRGPPWFSTHSPQTWSCSEPSRTASPSPLRPPSWPPRGPPVAWEGTVAGVTASRTPPCARPDVSSQPARGSTPMGPARLPPTACGPGE